MDKVLFDRQVLVGIKKIDDQHRKFVTWINELADAIASDKGQEAALGIFEELIRYADYHFRTEEALFKKYSYVAAEEHIKAHQSFRKILSGFKKNYDHAIFSFKLIEFMVHWFITHVRDMDQKYVSLFKSKGL